MERLVYLSLALQGFVALSRCKLYSAYALGQQCRYSQVKEKVGTLAMIDSCIMYLNVAGTTFHLSHYKLH